MLFEAARHEPLADIPWSADAAREAMADIVQDTERHRMDAGGWSAHPRDREDDVARERFHSMYLGTAGVLWMLGSLQREGAVTLAGDPQRDIAQVAAAYLDAPDTGSAVPSYMLGESGIRSVEWRLTGSRDAADRLHEVVRSNIANPTNEMLWAAPGTMLGAWHLWCATHEARWRDLFADNVDQLWREWQFDEEARCFLWTQDMYGRRSQFSGAGHGFAGNVHPLLKGASLLDAKRRETLFERCVQTLQALATFDGESVNWRPRVSTAIQPDGTGIMMQWCHGAPGIVTALADFPPGLSTEMEAMLVAAGRATWQAGPLRKGYGLCHGTAGNGYAFLTLHQRTGDDLWLDRARRFAMHAVAQMRHARSQQAQGRYALWTGDTGLAMYLWQCLQAKPGLPVVDWL